MNYKPVILVFNKYYLPGYKAGGPIRTLANMVDYLSDEFSFHIVTLDHDMGDYQSYAHIEHGVWNRVDKAQVMYLYPGSFLSQQLVKLILDVSPDVIYLNSFFDSTFTQRVLLARRLARIGNDIPIILAPRGEFSKGALRLKRKKKQIFIFIVSLLGLYRNLIWQASSSYEKDDILKSMRLVKESNIKVANDLASKKSTSLASVPSRQTAQALKVCFLSRISPKKNLDFALQVLGLVTSDIMFTIYGPKEE